MAKKVKEFQFRSRGSNYDDAWFDGDVWQLDVGPKGDVQNALTAEQAFRRIAKEKGLKARVSRSEDGKTVTVQAYEGNGEEAAPKAKRKAKAK